MAAEWQTPLGADVVLRASGGKEFHTHKIILSLASPVFRDMFSVPQPTSIDSSELPIVDVNDPPEALGTFLQIIYPGRNPLTNDIETLASVLRLADKYDAKDVLDAHKDYIPSTYSKLPPIEMYAILCACGREEEAGAAARRVSFASLQILDSNPLLQLITAAQYQRLVSFMTARDRKTREIVGRHCGDIVNGGGYPCCAEASHLLYPGTIVAAIQAAFEEDPCVQVGTALSWVASAPRTFPPCRPDCKYGVVELRKYVEALLADLLEMGRNLSWEDPHKK